jgi:hypothetical protein
MSFPTDTEKRVLIPAIYHKGGWMPFYGGEMPKLKEGTHADIYVPEEAFTNLDEIMRFNIDEIVTILPAGSHLWAMMSPNHGMGGPGLGIPQWAKTRPQDGLENFNLVEFQISEGLTLHLRGTKHAQLGPCQCNLAKVSSWQYSTSWRSICTLRSGAVAGAIASMYAAMAILPS